MSPDPGILGFPVTVLGRATVSGFASGFWVGVHRVLGLFLLGSCIRAVLIQKTRERRRVYLFLVRGGPSVGSRERKSKLKKRLSV